MDENLRKVWQKRIERTMENLKKNNIDAYYAEKASDVVPIVESLVAEGSIVASGGSVSLEQSGVAALLRSGRYEYLD
ncbi:MAG: lactate utilization protein, partial [Oscillospiraceae bacterium]|nr:lactate utilization protein [Oscillospiraceae bacterium]